MKKNKFYFVYKTTNLINNEFYIGKHVTSNLEDGYLGSGKNIIKSIKKYGKDNFKREILFYCSNKDELVEKEAEVITNNFFNPLCVNKTNGKNYGFDYINKLMQLKKLNHPTKGIPIHYKKTKNGFIFKYLKNTIKGWTIGRPSFTVYNDGKKKYYLKENQLGLVGEKNLSIGSIPGTYNYPMLGKKRSRDTIEKIKNTLKNGAKLRGMKISNKLKEVGEDGLSIAQRCKLKIQENGKTVAQNTGDKLKKNKSSYYHTNNPNYLIMSDGKSLPYHTNKKRVDNGTHNLLTLTKDLSSMGCHPSQIKKRLFIMGSYYSNINKIVMSIENYETYISDNKDSEKLNYNGWKYSIRKYKEQVNNNIVLEEIK